MLAADPTPTWTRPGPGGRRVVADHIATAAAVPAPHLVGRRDALVAAVSNALFGLGRFQPLVDDPRVENIESPAPTTWY
jgi:hypothetical protein